MKIINWVNKPATSFDELFLQYTAVFGALFGTIPLLGLLLSVLP